MSGARSPGGEGYPIYELTTNVICKYATATCYSARADPWGPDPPFVGVDPHPPPPPLCSIGRLIASSVSPKQLDGATL